MTHWGFYALHKLTNFTLRVQICVHNNMERKSSLVLHSKNFVPAEVQKCALAKRNLWLNCMDKCVFAQKFTSRLFYIRVRFSERFATRRSLVNSQSHWYFIDKEELRTYPSPLMFTKLMGYLSSLRMLKGWFWYGTAWDVVSHGTKALSWPADVSGERQTQFLPSGS